MGWACEAQGRGGNRIAQDMRRHNAIAVFHLGWKRLCGTIVLSGTAQSDETMPFASSRQSVTLHVRDCIAYERRWVGIDRVVVSAASILRLSVAHFVACSALKRKEVLVRK